MNKWFKSGNPWIWMTAGAVSISLVAVIGLLLLIAARGLVYFWPSPVLEMEVKQFGETQTVIIPVTVSDENGASSTTDLTFEITGSNHAPTVNLGAKTTLDFEDTDYSLQANK